MNDIEYEVWDTSRNVMQVSYANQDVALAVALELSKKNPDVEYSVARVMLVDFCETIKYFKDGRIYDTPR